MTVMIDAGAVMWSSPERDRATKPLLVLLHGYGSHEGDLFGLSPYLPLDVTIASVRAPLAQNPGFAWFAIPDNLRSPVVAQGADAAAVALLEWLDTVRASSIGILGFSQGGAMALQVLRHAPDRIDFAVALAGFAVPGTVTGDARMREVRPPVFWGRGTRDDVIPDAAVVHTQTWLPEHAEVRERIYEDLGHEVSEAELRDAVDFLRERWA